VIKTQILLRNSKNLKEDLDIDQRSLAVVLAGSPSFVYQLTQRHQFSLIGYLTSASLYNHLQTGGYGSGYTTVKLWTLTYM